ncbi:MAG TPA: hypothetical protein VEJ18_20585, partial [Planctomycetota bacterium]|nr:hypothetical protein [Planctomycetota bacterium]
MIILLALQATLSFSDQAPSGHPRAIRTMGPGALEVDLSALRPDVEVYRAVLRLGRDEPSAAARRREAPRVSAGAPLRLAPPRFDAFDATEAVASALRRDPPRLKIDV